MFNLSGFSQRKAKPVPDESTVILLCNISNYTACAVIWLDFVEY